MERARIKSAPLFLRRDLAIVSQILSRGEIVFCLRSSYQKYLVILSEAYFSGVEGPAFGKLTLSLSALN
jgi:hypothetical protein